MVDIINIIQHIVRVRRNDMQKSKKMLKTRKDVKIAMVTKDITFDKVAKSIERQTNLIYKVLYGTGSSEKAERALESAFGRPIYEIRNAWNTEA